MPKKRRNNNSQIAKATKSLGTKIAIAIGVLVAVAFVIAVVRPQIMYRVPYLGRVFAYADFMLRGPRVPEGGLYGIDVSKHQGAISWEEVDLRYDLMSRRMSTEGAVIHKIFFAIAKASEGTTLDDSLYERNRNGANKAGAKFGAYHYFSYITDPLLQAKHFIRTAKLETGNIAPVLDIEEDGVLTRLIKQNKISKEAIQQKAMTWLNAVEQEYNCKPIIYTSANFKEDYLDSEAFNEYPLWIAHYQVSAPRYEGDIWQFTEQGKINGIKGDVDINVFSGDAKAFERLLIK